MTRSDVKKVAWTLRLIGYGLLVGSLALVAMGAPHASAAPACSTSAPCVK